MKNMRVLLWGGLLFLVCAFGISAASVPSEQQMVIHPPTRCQNYANGTSVAYGFQIQGKSEDFIHARLRELYDFNTDECSMVIETAKIIRIEKGPVSIEGVYSLVYQHCVEVRQPR